MGCGVRLRSFNPTLVRLRRSQPSLYLEQQQRFQSHAGSIEAIDEWGHLKLVLISFNPTLVRLRPHSGMGRPSAGPLFQSHAGSIEAARSGSGSSVC